jgi:protein gp37
VGVSLESNDYLFRVEHLRKTGAAVKFLSLEPSLDRLVLRGIDWVIAGGESGPQARPLDPAWVREVRDRCQNAGVPFFFKQWGGVFKSRTGWVLDGRSWDEMPTIRPGPAILR